MLNARTIPATVIKLGKGEVAVFLKQGTSWNGLTEHLCIAPASLAGGKMVTADKGTRSHFAEVFAEIAGLEPEPLQVVICDPKIERALKEAEAHFLAKDQAKDAADQASKHPKTTQV